MRLWKAVREAIAASPLFSGTPGGPTVVAITVLEVTNYNRTSHHHTAKHIGTRG
jgi:hypothetical protein